MTKYKEIVVDDPLKVPQWSVSFYFEERHKEYYVQDALDMIGRWKKSEALKRIGMQFKEPLTLWFHRNTIFIELEDANELN